jgi:nicotinate-nucleotide adenylyltransferase
MGHLRAALEVAEAFSLDRLLLIPSANPPHKSTDDMASARERLEMLRLAIEGVPYFDASDVELARSGPSYTIETLRYFQDHFGEDSTIHFVVGQDAFSEITTWKSFRQLFATAHFIVMARPGARLKSLEGFIRTNISKDYQYDGRSNLYSHPEWCSIFCLNVTHLDISATRIRETIRRGRSIRFLVPPQVEAFIKRKGLYQ